MINNSPSPILARFSEYLKNKGYSKSSIKNYRSDLKHFLNFLSSLNFQLDQLNKQVVKEYLSHLDSLPLSSATKRRRLASLLTFGQYWQETHHLPHNPFQLLSKKISKHITVQQIVENFLEDLKASGNSKSTIKNYRSDINKYLKWQKINFPQAARLTEIFNQQLIEEYLTQLEKVDNLPDSSRRRYRASLKSLLSWSLKKGYLRQKVSSPAISKPLLQPSSPHQSIYSRHPWLRRLPPSVQRIFIWRPKWYYQYHQLAFTSYLHLAILIIFATAIGIFAYQQLVTKAPTPLAYPSTLTTPQRKLSFQGRLTDANGNPITSTTNVVFKIYDAQTGGNVIWNSVGQSCSITPDEDGIFSVIFGGDCGPAINEDVFTKYNNAWLEITVDGETLSPRYPLSTVPYALNSETLQGFPASASATANTVPVINSSGNLVLAASSPTIESTSGTFAIKGQSLSLQTPDLSNGDITIAPDGDVTGSGKLNLIFEASSGNMVNAQGGANLTSGSIYYSYFGGSDQNDVYLFKGATATGDKFKVSTEGDLWLSRAATVSGSLAVDTNTLFVDSTNHRVGIGTTNPGSYKLYVNGQGYFNNGIDVGTDQIINATGGELKLSAGGGTVSIINNDNLSVTGDTTLGDAAGDTLTFNASTLAVPNNLNVDSGTLYIDAANNRIGIGTTSPGYKLDVRGNTQIRASIPALKLSGVETNGADWMLTENAGDFYILEGAAGTSRLYIKSGGNVGIGTTSPTQKLHVEGGIRLGSTSSTYNVLDTAAQSGAASGDLYWGNQALATQTYAKGASSRSLVTNGHAEMGDNTNFSSLTYYTGDCYSGNSCFTKAGSSIVISNELIEVSPDDLYKLRGWFKSVGSGGQSKLYFGLTPYDKNGNKIEYYMVHYYENTKTTLAADLNPGDTTVSLSSGANWHDSNASTYQRYIGFWNTGDYPNYTYTRTVVHYSDVSGDTVTLDSAWSGPTIPAGTAVANMYAGSSYQYIAAISAYVPTSWTEYGNIIKGWNNYGQSSDNDSFRYGTRYVKILFLLNYSQDSTYETRIDGIEFSQEPYSTVLYEDPVNDYLGIGTTSPGAKLDINASNGGYVRLSPDDGALEIGSGNDAVSYIDFHGSAHLNSDYTGRIKSDDSEMYACDAAGNCTLISPHDPKTGKWIFYSENTNGTSLKVAMEDLTEKINQLLGGGYVVKNGEPLSISPNALNVIDKTGTYLVIVDPSGNVGIGTTDPGSYKLYVSGTAYSTGGWQSSDIRLKNVQKYLSGALDKVEKLEPFTFTWKRDQFPNKGLPSGTHIGVAAQQLQEVYPELVNTDNEGYLTVDYAGLSVVNLEAIRELNAKVASNLGKIAELELDQTGEIVASPAANTSVPPSDLPAQAGESLAGHLGGGTSEVVYKVVNQFGRVVTRMANFAEIASAKIKAGLVDTKQLIAEVITTNSLDVQKHLSTPLIQVAEIRNEKGDVKVNLKKESGFGKLLVQGKNGKTVASIDSKGNATFSGSLKAKEASFSGKLVAKDVVTNKGSISQLLDKLEEEQHQASNSSQLALSSVEQLRQTIDELLNKDSTTQQLQEDGQKQATASSQLLNQLAEGELTIDNLTTNNLITTQTALLADTIVNGTLSVSSCQDEAHCQVLSLSSQGINSLNSTLFIQPNGLNKVDILAGTLVVAQNGQVYINGDLAVNGNLLAEKVTTGKIESAEGGLDITLKEASGSSQTAAVRIKDSQEKTVASIDNHGRATFGDLMAKEATISGTLHLASNDKTKPALDVSGDASVSGQLVAKKIIITTDKTATNSASGNFGNLLEPEISSNATAGNGRLKAGTTTLKVKNPNLTHNSLVYLTPTSDTQNQVPYVASKFVDEEHPENSYFVIKINRAVSKDILLNWWIIN